MVWFGCVTGGFSLWLFLQLLIKSACWIHISLNWGSETLSSLVFRVMAVWGSNAQISLSSLPLLEATPLWYPNGKHNLWFVEDCLEMWMRSNRPVLQQLLAFCTSTIMLMKKVYFICLFIYFSPSPSQSMKAKPRSPEIINIFFQSNWTMFVTEMPSRGQKEKLLKMCIICLPVIISVHPLKKCRSNS